MESVPSLLPALERIWEKVPYANRRSELMDEHLDAVLSAVEKSKPLVVGQFWPDFTKTMVRHPFRTQLVYFRRTSGDLQDRTVAEVLRDIIEGKR